MLGMTQPPDPGPGDRATRAAAVYARLFGERDPADLDAHPALRAEVDAFLDEDQADFLRSA